MKPVRPIIETEKLLKVYTKGSFNIRAIDGISVRISPQEFIGIYGPSGSGKSTLLHLFGAIDRPTKGSLKFNGFEVGTLKKQDLALLRQRIGFVFQDFNLIPRLTAYQNIELGLIIQGHLSRIERKNQIYPILDTLEMTERMNHTPSELSGGEQQRVAIARALAQEPKILLMDEPTGNLDSTSRNNLLKTIKEIHKEYNLTIIIVTHDRQISKYCNRIITLTDGKIISDTHTSSHIMEESV